MKTGLTSSKQIGQRESLSGVCQSLYTAVGKAASTCAGVALGFASPNVAARASRPSYEVSKSSSR